MPLPYALDHINLWAIEDGTGWALVDTGVRTEDNAAVWRELFANHAHDHAPADARDRDPCTPTTSASRVADAQVRRAPVDDAARYLNCRARWCPTPAAGAADAIDLLPPRRLDRRMRPSVRASATSASHTLPTATAGCRPRAVRDQRAPLSACRRQRPLARARLPALRRARRADLRRPGPAAHLVQRLGPTRSSPDANPMQQWARFARHAASARCRPTCWCCSSHNEPFRGLHDWDLDALASAASSGPGAPAAQPGREAQAARSTCSAPSSRARSARTTCRLLGMATGEGRSRASTTCSRVARWCASGRAGWIGIRRLEGEPATFLGTAAPLTCKSSGTGPRASCGHACKRASWANVLMPPSACATMAKAARAIRRNAKVELAEVTAARFDALLPCRLGGTPRKTP